MNSFVKTLSFFLLAFAFSGCASLLKAPANPNPEAWIPPMPADESTEWTHERALQTGDQVNISIMLPNATAGDKLQDIIDAQGCVTIPLAGEIRIGGTTTAEAEKTIRSALIDGKFYRDVNVMVVCPAMASELGRMYYVTGCMRQRGQFPFRDGMTLREAVIAAGDLTDFASGTIVITRGGQQLKFDLDKIKRGTEQDPQLRPRDIIEAKERIF